MTASFVILADYIFNEKSSLCLLPSKFKNLNYILDENDDGIITDKEIQHAENILLKAKKQKKKIEHLEISSFMNNKVF